MKRGGSVQAGCQRKEAKGERRRGETRKRTKGGGGVVGEGGEEADGGEEKEL